LFFESLYLLFESFILALQAFHIYGGGCPQVPPNVVEWVDGSFGLFVKTHQHFGQGIEDARLFEVPAVVFLFRRLSSSRIVVGVAVAAVVVGLWMYGTRR
jgi:hypothetical protein